MSVPEWSRLARELPSAKVLFAVQRYHNSTKEQLGRLNGGAGKARVAQLLNATDDELRRKAGWHAHAIHAAGEAVLARRELLIYSTDPADETDPAWSSHCHRCGLLAAEQLTIALEDE